MRTLIIMTITLITLNASSLHAQVHQSANDGYKLMMSSVQSFLSTVESADLQSFQEYNSGDFILLTNSTSVAYREKEAKEQPLRSAEKFRFDGVKSLRFSKPEEKLNELGTYLYNLNGGLWDTEFSLRLASSKSSLQFGTRSSVISSHGRTHRLEIVAKRSFETSPTVHGWITVRDRARLEGGDVIRNFSIANVVFFH